MMMYLFSEPANLLLATPTGSQSAGPTIIACEQFSLSLSLSVYIYIYIYIPLSLYVYIYIYVCILVNTTCLTHGFSKVANRVASHDDPGLDTKNKYIHT